MFLLIIYIKKKKYYPKHLYIVHDKNDIAVEYSHIRNFYLKNKNNKNYIFVRTADNAGHVPSQQKYIDGVYSYVNDTLKNSINKNYNKIEYFPSTDASNGNEITMEASSTGFLNVNNVFNKIISLTSTFQSGSFYAGTGEYKGTNSLGGFNGEWIKMNINTTHQNFMSIGYSLTLNLELVDSIPKTIKFLGSNDNTNWALIKSVTYPISGTFSRKSTEVYGNTLDSVKIDTFKNYKNKSFFGAPGRNLTNNIQYNNSTIKTARASNIEQPIFPASNTINNKVGSTKDCWIPKVAGRWNTNTFAGTEFTIVNGTNYVADWIDYEFNKPVSLENFTIFGRSEIDARWLPSEFKLLASHDGTNYIVINSYSNLQTTDYSSADTLEQYKSAIAPRTTLITEWNAENNPGHQGRNFYKFFNNLNTYNKQYKYYRFAIKKVTTGGAISISEIEMNLRSNSNPQAYFIELEDAVSYKHYAWVFTEVLGNIDNKTLLKPVNVNEIELYGFKKTEVNLNNPVSNSTTNNNTTNNNPVSNNPVSNSTTSNNTGSNNTASNNTTSNNTKSDSTTSDNSKSNNYIIYITIFIIILIIILLIIFYLYR